MLGELPKVYELSIAEGKNPSLVIGVPGRVNEFMVDTLHGRNAEFTDYTREALGLNDFTSPTNKKWGFNEVLETGRIPSSSGGVFWKCELPKGNMVEVTQQLVASSATLGIVFYLLNAYRYKEGEEGWIAAERAPQLMEVNLGIDMTLPHSRYPLTASVYPELQDFIRVNANSRDGVIERVMEKSFRHMNGRDLHFGRHFRAYYFENGGISLQVPGDACDLSSSYDDYGEGLPIELHPHNIDNPQQQLAMVMGLATLQIQARSASNR